MFKQFTDLDFSASSVIQTDEKVHVAIENIARKIHNKQEKAMIAALTAYYDVSDVMECVDRVTRVVDRLGASRLIDNDTGEVITQFNKPFMRTEPGSVAPCFVADYSITVNSFVADRVKEALYE
ncbi:hypothetical protein CPTT1_079 [Escherichia phage T1]|uniref:Uncharacterized protein n=2 Tax=Escherichia phage T1 TaxID=2492962 RepID=A0A3S9W160_BPT1|nr:hypothetical protein ST1 [Escherichia phage T1]AAP49998.1 hypothetical protein CPTT1_079 [Escherichia phage T1]AZS32436.1 hypothetical protein [Escherichia phage T1]